MTTPEMLSLLIAPLGALVMGAVAFYITRKDAKANEHKADRNDPLPKQPR